MCRLARIDDAPSWGYHDISFGMFRSTRRRSVDGQTRIIERLVSVETSALASASPVSNPLAGVVKTRTLILMASLVALLLGGISPANADRPPGKGGSGGASLTYTEPGEGVTTMDATGCNMDVCIGLYSLGGSGNYIITVTGTGKIASDRCVTFDVDADYTTVARSNVVCGKFGGTFLGKWEPNRRFNHGTRICVAFRGVGASPSVVGYPCKTVLV
jgi:hypothetical protein